MEHTATVGRPLAKPTARRLLVASPFVAVAVVLVVLAIFFMQLMSAARAYVGGESLWTKSQKQAVQSLVRFTQLRDGAEWVAYRQAIANKSINEQIFRQNELLIQYQELMVTLAYMPAMPAPPAANKSGAAPQAPQPAKPQAQPPKP